MNYIIFWKDSPGQQVNTVVDADNAPVIRDSEYIANHRIQTLNTEEQVLEALENATGAKYAIVPALARATLGWDV